jgi:precorrin-2 dehydrogenase/sirohydrochlorin ferrochelatase
MAYYPIIVELKDKKIIVVGGGNVAQRKVMTLVDCGADVHIISKELSPLLKVYEKERKVSIQGTEFKEDELNGAYMVIAATDDPIENSRIGKSAKKRGILVNVVDQPDDCNFIVPSIVKRGDLIIAVSTSGKSPALARKLRKELESLYGKEYEDYLNLMGGLRKEIITKGGSSDENREIFTLLVDSPLFELICEGEWEKIAALISGILKIEITQQKIINYLKAE